MLALSLSIIGSRSLVSLIANLTMLSLCSAIKISISMINHSIIAAELISMLTPFAARLNCPAIKLFVNASKWSLIGNDLFLSQPLLIDL